MSCDHRTCPPAATKNNILWNLENFNFWSFEFFNVRSVEHLNVSACESLLFRKSQALTCWHCYMFNFWNFEVLQSSNVEHSICWTFQALKHRNNFKIGMLKSWRLEVLGLWKFEMFKVWDFELVKLWIVEAVGFAICISWNDDLVATFKLWNVWTCSMIIAYALRAWNMFDDYKILWSQAMSYCRRTLAYDYMTFLWSEWISNIRFGAQRAEALRQSGKLTSLPCPLTGSTDELLKIWLMPDKVKLGAYLLDRDPFEDVRMLEQLSFATGATDQLSDEQPKPPEVKDEPPPSPKKLSEEEQQKEDLDKFHAEAQTHYRR